MKKLALLVMAAFSASLIFACSSDPEIVEVVKEVIVEKEVEKIVEVPVEKIVTKIVTESVPQPVGYMMEAPENVTNTGGTLKTAFGVTMGHFDAAQGTGTHVLGHAYDCLHVKNIADGLRTFAPLLATEWDIASDGKTYTFTIREGVQFHDGSDLTVDDVVTSFSRMALPQDGFVSPNASFYDVVTSIEAKGNQVVFKLSEPRTWLLEVMSGTSHLVYSKAQIDANDNNLKSVEIPTGTGPYKFNDHMPAEKWVFDKNENYWSPNTPYIDRLEMLHVPAWTDRGTAVLTGQADFSWNISMETHNEANKRNDVTSLKIPGFGAYNANFNNKKAPFDDVRVRKAIFLTVSKQGLHAAFSRNEPMKLTGWMSYAAEGATSIEDLGKLPGYREDKTADIAEAKKLMAAAGHPDGFGPIDLVVSSVAPHSEILAPFFADELEKIGITSKIRVIERSQLGQNALAGEYDIQVTTAFGSPTQDPTPMWMQRLTCDGSQNQVHYCNPEFDKMVATLNVTSDPGDRADLFAKAKAFLDEENPLYTIGFTNHLPAWQNYVKGMAMEQRSHTHWGELTTVWLDR
jgi:peptide/nickel transport system substrate-binding protein